MRKTASCANGNSAPPVTEMVTPNAPDPRWKNAPGGVPVGVSVLPGAGVDAEIVMLAGADGCVGVLLSEQPAAASMPADTAVHMSLVNARIVFRG